MLLFMQRLFNYLTYCNYFISLKEEKGTDSVTLEESVHTRLTLRPYFSTEEAISKTLKKTYLKKGRRGNGRSNRNNWNLRLTLRYQNHRGYSNFRRREMARTTCNFSSSGNGSHDL
jgi:hypothetical protein